MEAGMGLQWNGQRKKHRAAAAAAASPLRQVRPRSDLAYYFTSYFTSSFIVSACIRTRATSKGVPMQTASAPPNKPAPALAPKLIGLPFKSTSERGGGWGVARYQNTQFWTKKASMGKAANFTVFKGEETLGRGKLKGR